MDATGVLFIQPSHNFIFENIRKAGCDIDTPYIGKTIFLRLIRAVWFKYRLPFAKIWFNKAIAKYRAETIIVSDSIITGKYLIWLRDVFPTARIVFMYDNMVGRASHLIPHEIPEGCVDEKWSYDKGDCEKYGMNHSGNFYFEHLRVEKKEAVYDALFVGRDKGRANYLFDLERQLNEQGLKTYFHIVADRLHKRFNKPYYQRVLKYGEICALLAKSKAIVNIALDGQIGSTFRDMESAFNGIKLITTNEHIRGYDFYRPENIFVLNKDNVGTIRMFLEQPYRPLGDDVLERYTFGEWLKRVIKTGKAIEG